jgi:hypothetical protein
MRNVETLILSKQELINFAKEIYSDSCAGYMDLKDATCQSKVDKLFDQKKSFIKRDQQSTFNWDTGSTTTGWNLYNTVTFSTNHYGLDMSNYTLETSNLSLMPSHNDFHTVPNITVAANENFLNLHSTESEDSNTSF